MIWLRYFLFVILPVSLLSIFSLSAGAACLPEAELSLQVLGSGGPEINDGRASSGYLIWQQGKAVIMVDSGTGTASNFEKSGASLNDLQAVLFTHFHVDHSLDFPALIKASYFTGRNKDLKVFGPAGNALMPSATEFIQTLLGEQGAYRYLDEYLLPERQSDYKIRVVEVPLMPQSVSRYSLNESISLSAIPVQHGPVAAVAWRVDINGCSVAFTGDMNNRLNTVSLLAKNVDLLVANNAIPEAAAGGARYLHMPPSEIGKIAASAKVRQLILSHRMLRTLGNERATLEEIRQYYSGPVKFSNDLDRYSIFEKRD